MNLIIINGKITKVAIETETLLCFVFQIEPKPSEEKDAFLIFTIKNQSVREKLKKLFSDDTKVLVEGSLEEHPELPEGIKIRVKKFDFLQSLHEKLEEHFMSFDELNSFLENELDEFLKKERNIDNE